MLSRANFYPCRTKHFTRARTTCIGSPSTGKFGTGTANTSTARVKLAVQTVIRAEPKTFRRAFPLVSATPSSA